MDTEAKTGAALRRRPQAASGEQSVGSRQERADALAGMLKKGAGGGLYHGCIIVLWLICFPCLRIRTAHCTRRLSSRVQAQRRQ